MKISIISASHRTNSQSKKILDVLHNNLSNIDSDLDIYDLDLADKLDMNSMVRENNAKEVGINKAIEWFDSIFERWNTDDKPYICSAKCNIKQDTVKLQYVAT